MAQQTKGLITRLLEGKEKSEEYARSTLPTNRWQLFWDVFKGNFGKIVKVNLLTLLFFVPMIAVIIFVYMLGESNSVIYPFGANLGVGYPAAPQQQGVSEYLTMQTTTTLGLGLIITSAIAAVGLAGGMYVIRNMVWTEGIFVSNDFWRGIKLNYKNALQTALFFCIIFFFSTLMINFAEFSISMQNLVGWKKTWMVLSQVMSYLFIVLAAFMSFWMIALGVNYKFKFMAMLRNAFLLMIGTLPQTVFFGALSFIPYVFFVFGEQPLLMTIGILLVLLFGLAYTLLVWLNFGQWVFDKYINPRIEGAKVGRGIYNKDGSSQLTGNDSAAAIEYQRSLLAYGKSKLVAHPIKPIDDSLQVYELPQSFSREDLQRLRESKQNIVEDSAAYAEEHKNDLRYVEYNKQFEERERALQEQDDKKKKRKKPRILEDE